MLKKISIFFSLIAVATLFAACNNKKITQENKQTIQNNKQINQNNKKNNNDDKVVIYIDRNCERAGIAQCNTFLWQEVARTELKKVNPIVKYISATGDKDLIKTITKYEIPTPVLVVPEDKVDLLGEAGKIIKEKLKPINGKYYVKEYYWEYGKENLCNDGKDNNGDGKIDKDDPTCKRALAITSYDCNEKYCSKSFLKDVLLGYYTEVKDYKQLSGYDEIRKMGITTLPIFLINKKNKYMQANYIKKLPHPIAGFKYVVHVPYYKYDPSIEVCKTNCNASPACKKLLVCNKSDKPKVELFVMSYCPYGLQAEKGLIPVIKLLKDKIDFKVNFVNYAMHGKKEIDENNLQYCIQKEEPNKYMDYLICFLDKGDTKGCLKKANINTEKINACVEKIKKEYKTEKDYNNKSTWLNGQFPKYEVNEKLNRKYDIQGSPTLVINGIKVVPKDRSPQSYLELICKAFKKEPKECKVKLSDKSYNPMFGWGEK